MMVMCWASASHSLSTISLPEARQISRWNAISHFRNSTQSGQRAMRSMRRRVHDRVRDRLAELTRVFGAAADRPNSCAWHAGLLGGPRGLVSAQAVLSLDERGGSTLVERGRIVYKYANC